ncbi:DUF4266 domain-containing protein [candidate division KSB1 bacterium]|nr:DUF4266 domain-containing protein [candidate division KSB1 bacterium]
MLIKRASSALAVCLFAIGLHSCAAVKPYEREYLSKKIMDFRTEANEEASERHWLETLEASSGGVGGSGGGCACN